MDKIYLDYAATTPLAPAVFEKMVPFFSEDFGNPSSIHTWGQRAEAALEGARESVAESLNCHPEEIIFTSGGSESDNLALRGTALARRQVRGTKRILISPVEHPAVTETARQLQQEFGFDLDFIPVDDYGRVIPGELGKSLDANTVLVSAIYANNEIGSINHVNELADICRQKGVPFHTDAVQAAGHLVLNMRETQIDLLSIGAHKFYGPKGVGVLFIRKGTIVNPIQTGGKQENGMRAGTHNIPYIVGLAEALKITKRDLQQNTDRLISSRDTLISGVLASIPDSKLTGHPTERLPNHASFVFKNVNGNDLLMILDRNGFACSSGSACKVGESKPSEVLLNLGVSADWASGSLRVTLGRQTTLNQIEKFLTALPEIVRSLRKLGS